MGESRLTSRDPEPEASYDPGAYEATEAARLRHFVTWLLPSAIGFGVLELTLAWVLGDQAMALAGLVMVGYAGLVAVGGRGGVPRTVAAVGGGLLFVVLASVLVVPAFAAVLAVTPLLAMAVILPHARGRVLWASLVACWLTTAAVLLAGMLLPDRGTMPSWVTRIVHDTALLALVTLIMVLLWQFSRRLIATLAQTQAALVALRESQARLLQAEKLAAIGTLAAGVAHELNQPLMVARGRAQVLLREPGLADGPRRQAAIIERQTEKMGRIIDHLRGFGRTSTASAATAVELNLVVEEALLLIGAQLRESGSDVLMDLAVPPPVALADANEVEQIVLNLLINARDALSVGERAIRADDAVTVRTWQQGADCHLAVLDTGPGLPEESLARVFEPFYTTKEVGQGTGLGLAIARDIAHRWGGELTVANRPDRSGVVATLTLPMAIDLPDDRAHDSA